MALKNVQLILEGYTREESKAFSLSHVELIFASFLPNDFDIDGHQKILLNYVRKPSKRLDDYISLKPRIGSISSLEIRGFEPSNFLCLNHDERAEEATRLIRDGLKKIANRKNVPTEPIDEAYEQTIASDFTISWKHKKTSKLRMDRKYRVDTHCRIDKHGTSVALEFSYKREKIDSVVTATNKTWRSIYFEYWNAQWQGDEVAISNRVGDEVLRFRIINERKVEPVGPGSVG